MASHYHCPMCGSRLMKTGRVPILILRSPDPLQIEFSRESLALACSFCSCVIEVSDDTAKLLDFPGLRVAHLQTAWPGLRFLDYTHTTPRGVSVLYGGES